MSPSKSKMPGLLTKSGAQINAESHRPSLHTSIPRLSYLLAGCIALGVAAVCKPLLFGLGTGVLSIVVCTLPPLAVVAVARPPIDPCPPTPTGPPQAPYKSRLTTLGFCFMGIGLYMGVIGFSSDNLEPGTYASLQLMVGTLGALLACTLLALSMRVTPEGPYVLLPVLVGTTSLVFLLTTMAQKRSALRAPPSCTAALHSGRHRAAGGAPRYRTPSRLAKNRFRRRSPHRAVQPSPRTSTGCGPVHCAPI